MSEKYKECCLKKKKKKINILQIKKFQIDKNFFEP